MGMEDNIAGGKSPCFSQAGGEGKREGMTETAQSKNPKWREPIDKVRRLQRKLYGVAKQQPGRRFHALYERIYRSDVLWEAWKRVDDTISGSYARYTMKTIVKPCAGKPQARFERRFLKTGSV